MPKSDKLSLTTFVDFVLKAGTPKLTVVRNFKNRPEYDPAIDFYKPLRDEILRMHANGEPKKALDAFLGIAYAKKRVQYAAVIAGYQKYLGKKVVTWFDPPSDVWTARGITVSVNPELGLQIGGVPYVIKLYFKGDKLAKNRMEIINHLMASTLGDPKKPRTFGVLDMRNAKLHTAATDPGLAALLQGEAASFAAMLGAV